MSQCAREVKNVTTNKNNINMELRLFALDFSESSQRRLLYVRRLNNSLKLVLDVVSNTEQL